MTNLQIPQPNRIGIAPAGRGWKARPEILVNADYVHSLLEENRITERDESLMRYLAQVNILKGFGLESFKPKPGCLTALKREHG